MGAGRTFQELLQQPRWEIKGALSRIVALKEGQSVHIQDISWILNPIGHGGILDVSEREQCQLSWFQVWGQKNWVDGRIVEEQVGGVVRKQEFCFRSVLF